MIMSWFILDDKAKAERQIHSNSEVPEEHDEDVEDDAPIIRGPREEEGVVAVRGRRVEGVVSRRAERPEL